MPIDDDDDGGDFKIVASIWGEFSKSARLLFFAFNAISLKYANIMQHKFTDRYSWHHFFALKPKLLMSYINHFKLIMAIASFTN